MAPEMAGEILQRAALWLRRTESERNTRFHNCGALRPRANGEHHRFSFPVRYREESAVVASRSVGKGSASKGTYPSPASLNSRATRD